MQKEHLLHFPVSAVLAIFGMRGRHQDQTMSKWEMSGDIRKEQGQESQHSLVKGTDCPTG